MARSANAEAIHHFSAALDLVPTLGETPEREAKELELCVKLGPALMIVKGTASSEVHAIYTRAAALRTGEDSPDRFKALWGLFYYSMTSGRLREAAAYARELLMLAAWRAGDATAAKRWSELIITDAQTPPGTRSRVEMLMALGAGQNKS